MRRGALRSVGGYDVEFWTLATASVATDESLTQQQFRDEVDINTIVRRFGLTQQLPVAIEGGVYGDFSEVTDYDSAVAMIERANSAFYQLAPEVRESFGNSPGEMVRQYDAGLFSEFPTPVVEAPVAPVDDAV